MINVSQYWKEQLGTYVMPDRPYITPEELIKIEYTIEDETLTFLKDDLFSFTHTQDVDLNSLTLPKNQIQFSIDNADGRFNPDNPTGLYEKITEKQEVDLYYGLRTYVDHEYYPYDTGTPYITRSFSGYKNQLILNGNFADTSEWFCFGGSSFTVNDNIATIIFDSTTDSYLAHATSVNPLHKYYVRFYCKGNIGAIPYSNGFCPDYAISTADWEVREAIKDDFIDSQTMLITTSDYSTLQLKNVMLIDLTLMFGTGNEPSTVEEAKFNIKSVYNDTEAEWHKAGTFYMSGWDTPQNGLSATFTASSQLDFGKDKFGEITYTSEPTCYDLVQTAAQHLGITSSKIDISQILRTISVPYKEGTTYTVDMFKDTTDAAVIQYCANAGMCRIRYDVEGKIYIELMNIIENITDYTIDLFTSYKNPEYNLSKKIKNVIINNNFNVAITSQGESQQISNDLITTIQHAELYGGWLSSIINTRKEISGEYRCDPRLQVYDYITAINKYATNEIFITNLTITYSGLFKASYTGRVMTSKPNSEKFGLYYAGDNEYSGNTI